MEQTNRTILFEEINPELNNILTYVEGDSKESLPDSILRMIQDSLEVSSFDEFLDKMNPKLYLCMNADTKSVYCTTDATGENQQVLSSYKEVHVITMKRENMLLEYYLRKISGDTNVCEVADIKSKFVELIYPLDDKAAFRMAYSNIMSLLALNKEPEAIKALHIFCEKYNNSLILLPMIIEYIQEELYRLREGDVTTPIIVQNCKDTQIEIVKVSDAFLERSVSLNAHTLGSYEKVLQEHLQGVKNTSLLKDFFMIAVHGYEKDDEILKHMYEQYLNYYQTVIETFWNKCGPLLEKILGVYAFFFQYPLTGDGMQPKLLISNVTLRDIVNAKNKIKLDTYLNSANEKNNFENTIWYAIVPRMEYKNEDNQGNVRERFRGNDKKLLTDVNSVTEFQVLMDMLAKYRIQTFVSPVNTQNTTAEWVFKNGIYEWAEYQQEMIQRANAEYIYPSFPNFSITKEGHTEVRIGGQYEENEYRSLWLRTVGIEASYVAAGMFAAMQCPVFLAQHFRNKISMEYPGVGFRILENDNNLKLPCTLKSGIFMFPQDVMEEVEIKCYGIFFAPHGNKIIIAQDRAMTGNYGIKDNVSIVQTLTYIERKMRYETQDFKSTLIEQFFLKRPNSLLANWSKNNLYLNSVLKQGENIQYNLDKENRECVLKIMFEQTKYERKVQMNQ